MLKGSHSNIQYSIRQFQNVLQQTCCILYHRQQLTQSSKIRAEFSASLLGSCFLFFCSENQQITHWSPSKEQDLQNLLYKIYDRNKSYPSKIWQVGTCEESLSRYRRPEKWPNKWNNDTEKTWIYYLLSH